MTQEQKQALAHYKRVRGKKNLEEALALRALMQANKEASTSGMIKILHGDDSKS